MDQAPIEIFPWRQSPFVPGRTYRLRSSFVAYSDAFEAGELVTFVRDAWSRYDGMTAYFFRDALGRDRRWDISDDEAIDRRVQVFELVDAASD